MHLLGINSELIHTVGHDQTSRSGCADVAVNEDSSAVVDRTPDEGVDFDHVF